MRLTPGNKSGESTGIFHDIIVGTLTQTGRFQLSNFLNVMDGETGRGQRSPGSLIF